MKKIYLAFFLGFSLLLTAQEKAGPTEDLSPESSDFMLYPNPAVNDIVYVKTKHNRSKSITVFDVFGKVVLRDRITSSTLNISRLVPGVYVLQVQENDKKMTRKLVVK
ncbi:T9SS type A sorting domain-containing protein [Muriicola sp. Z0-33]|uniref:T9SS type A sorting domain-containing protein n=1 Tax=Muriicola sp. Z0-33 TaxID=2816957 RepID=UPI00223822BB|nr:T9SS type A sorting domain-containing protein [Muriicola sp. Z0-33]MCW5515030.1 T9SS type A sorting domain-containing protein [Muriicola sp. Z0-33]